MERPGSFEYIFAKSRSSEIVGISYFSIGTSCERWISLTIIEKI
jgi:hypothetical protein